jgi:hypothetical protein
MVLGIAAVASDDKDVTAASRRSSPPAPSVWRHGAHGCLSALRHGRPLTETKMAFKISTLLAPAAMLVAASALFGAAGPALADNDALKCTAAAQSTWMSEDATKALLLKQGYQDIRKIKVTEGQCYEVYGIDAQGEKVEVYLDPTNGAIVAKED